MSGGSPEHFDVVIVGAGLSGVGAGCHLQMEAPDRSYVVLEARETLGGTWDLFRYPGVRSDSDIYTLGYAFRPWTEAKAIADGPAILSYIEETAREYGVDRRIRYGCRVRSAAWSSADATWAVIAERGGAEVRFTCRFLFLCGGYYRYDRGHAPEFPGQARFKGRLVHPQHWPADLDYAGKRVVVIGSGATAMTLVPAMAKAAAQVTMLQRSPTYVVARPSQDRFATWLGRKLPAGLAYQLVRWRNVLFGMYFFNRARSKPELAKRRIIGMVRKRLGPDFDVETNFTPTYNPWDQRLCLVPDADLFEVLKSGRARVVTDQIEAFTEDGIALRSGEVLPADIVVTATGLELEVLNGIELSVDGRPVEPAQTLSYKGMMYEGVPNLASAFGYTNASWTLKCDLTCEYVTRLLNHLRRTGLRQATPINDDPAVQPRPWLDFTSGYVMRAMARFPKQGDRAPWRLHQNYALDLMTLRYGRLEDGVLRFSNPEPGGAKAQRARRLRKVTE